LGIFIASYSVSFSLGRSSGLWVTNNRGNGEKSGLYVLSVSSCSKIPNSMKQLTIVVKPFRAEAVLRGIADMDVIACVVQEAKGYSRQKGYLDRYVGSEYSMAFLPKVEISVWVSDDKAEEVANRIIKSARTGRIGDGKIFVVNMGWSEPLEF
jgi:nitrogen regulatory protein PII